MKKLSLSALAVVVVLLGGLYGYTNWSKLTGQSFGAVTSSEYVYNVGNLVGTHVGTSTTGVASQIATTSYVARVAGSPNVTFIVKITSTTTSTNLTSFTFQGSNDYKCETTDTTTLNEVLVSDINWYGIGDHLVGANQSTALVNASSTNLVSWTNASSTAGQDITLVNLSYNCIRLGVAGTSTFVYVGVKPFKN